MMLQYLDIAIAIAVVMLAVSLLITILVQLVANVLSLRGSNLRWAVTTLIEEVHADYKADAAVIANTVLTHPLISDSTLSNFAKSRWIKGPLKKLWIRFSLATAVRLEELVGVLDFLGDASATATPAAKAMAEMADAAKKKMGPQVQAITKQASEVVTEVAKVSAASLPPNGWSGSINVDQLLERVPGAAETVFGKDIKSWFNSTMDRATQRFTLQMRIVTVALSVVVAFAMHLDSFQLFTDLSASPDLRASLVAQAGSMERLAGDVLANSKQPPAPAPAASGQAAPAPSAAPSAPLCPAAHMPAVYTQAIVELKQGTNPATDPELSKVVVPPDKTFADRKSGSDWLQAALIASSESETKGKDVSARLMPQYRSKIDCMLQSDTDKLLDRAADIHSLLGQTQLRLIPNPYPFDVRLWRWREWLGILFSAGLLGLGAPFWFNALKSMTALRPVLANKQEQESQS
jgi:hypothetical protein